MISIDARLTLLSLIPLPFVSISVKYFGSAIHKRFEQIQAQLSELSAVVQEALSGVRVVRAYRQEGHELERFRAANEEYLRRNRRLVTLQGLFFPSMSFFLGLGALITLWIGSRDVINGRITRRPVRGVQLLPHDAELAGDCVRLGDEHAAAGHGVLEADAGSAGDGSADTGRGTRTDRPRTQRSPRTQTEPSATSAPQRRRSAARSSSAISSSPTAPRRSSITSRSRFRPGRRSRWSG